MIVMTGLDWKRASLKQREAFAMDSEMEARFISELKDIENVLGCVLLTTCNRFEVYLDTPGQSVFKPLNQLIEKTFPLSSSEAREVLFRLTGDDAIKRIFEVTCGLHSQILGEDQILTQVKTALENAREYKASSASLETLFRLSVTAGKKAKTNVKLRTAPGSSAQRAVELAAEHLGNLAGKTALVIGNGEMGRLSADALHSRGCDVTVTLRSYRHGETVIPRGCKAIAYDERHKLINSCDILISATKSPHYTVSYDMVAGSPPAFIADISMPRDIDPDCRNIKGTIFLDLDDMDSPLEENREALESIDEIISEHIKDYFQWLKNREAYMSRMGEEKGFLRFPLFIDLTGKPCLVVGGGKIARRRTRVLLEHGGAVTVIAPWFSGQEPGAVYIQRPYQKGDIKGMELVVTATSDREVNREIGLECKALGIPVSVSDKACESSFFFPAVCGNKSLSCGLVSDGKNHHLTKKAAADIRRLLEETY